MFVILGLLLSGVAIGVWLRHCRCPRSVNTWIGRSVMWVVYLLLFVFGVKLGADKQISDSLADMGLSAVLLSLAGIIGSIVATVLTKKLMRSSR